MKIEVKIRDVRQNRLFTGVIEVPSDQLLRPFTLSDKEGNKLEFEARSDRPHHFQYLIRRNGGFVSFEFYGLETGREQRYLGGAKEGDTGRFVSTPLRVSVTKLEE